MVSPPKVEPISLKMAKDWTKFESDRDDELFNLIITAARQRLESWLGLSFITQAIRVVFFNYESEIELPYGPIQSITSVKRKYKEEIETLTENDDYHVVGSCPGLFRSIHPVRRWNTEVGRVPYEYIVTYTTGYGDEPEDVPAGIRAAMLDLVANAHENRNSTEIYLSRRIKEKVREYKQFFA